MQKQSDPFHLQSPLCAPLQTGSFRLRFLSSYYYCMACLRMPKVLFALKIARHSTSSRVHPSNCTALTNIPYPSYLESLDIHTKINI